MKVDINMVEDAEYHINQDPEDKFTEDFSLRVKSKRATEGLINKDTKGNTTEGYTASV